MLVVESNTLVSNGFQTSTKLHFFQVKKSMNHFFLRITHSISTYLSIVNKSEISLFNVLHPVWINCERSSKSNISVKYTLWQTSLVFSHRKKWRGYLEHLLWVKNFILFFNIQFFGINKTLLSMWLSLWKEQFLATVQQQIQ